MGRVEKEADAATLRAVWTKLAVDLENDVQASLRAPFPGRMGDMVGADEHQWALYQWRETGKTPPCRAVSPTTMLSSTGRDLPEPFAGDHATFVRVLSAGASFPNTCSW